MAQPLPHYLRARRLDTGLTQDEMAFLLGAGDGSRVSRYEAFRRLPDLNVALAYLAVHQGAAQELFVGQYCEVAAGVLDRARLLRARLDTRMTTARKVELLNTMILVLERGFELDA